MRRIIPVVCMITLFACEKAELPKPYSGAPSANTVSVSMGSDYGNQLFFNLESESVIAQNDRAIWDLAFESGETGRMIILNSAKFMAVSKTNETALSNVTTATATTWLYDNQKGESDSLALHDWELNKVYIVDRGLSVIGTQIGKVKFRITAFTETTYTIEWGALNTTTFFTNTISKNSDYNFTFFSFTNDGHTVAVEPKKDAWDLEFTSYTYVYPDGTPYLVTGVLSNRYLVRVHEVDTDFDAVDYAYCSSLNFTNDLDIIGYDWKFYDFDLSAYVIQFDKAYVIKSVEGIYYKLRFLDFYDAGGSKGTPSFELQKLVP